MCQEHHVSLPRDSSRRLATEDYRHVKGHDAQIHDYDRLCRREVSICTMYDDLDRDVQSF